MKKLILMVLVLVGSFCFAEADQGKYKLTIAVEPTETFIPVNPQQDYSLRIVNGECSLLVDKEESTKDLLVGYLSVKLENHEARVIVYAKAGEPVSEDVEISSDTTKQKVRCVLVN